MYKLSKFRVMIILAICLVGIFFAIPNIMPKSVKLPGWWQPVSLGLDLQGGSNLLLQVDFDTVMKDRIIITLIPLVKSCANIAFVTKIYQLTAAALKLRLIT